jgi:hypothetical protein
VALPAKPAAVRRKWPSWPSFVSDTASKTGKPERTIRWDPTRAKALGSDLDRVAGTSLDKGAELDALAVGFRFSSIYLRENSPCTNCLIVSTNDATSDGLMLEALAGVKAMAAGDQRRNAAYRPEDDDRIDQANLANAVDERRDRPFDDRQAGVQPART